MQRVVVLGGSGFIGSHVSANLRQLGHHVRVVGRTRHEERLAIADASEFVEADLLDIEATKRVVEDADWVVHLAATMGGVGYFARHQYGPYIANMTIDMNVLRACEPGQRLFYSASACAYPVHLQQREGYPPKLNEAMLYPANSDQMYGWEKLMMLQLCEQAPMDARVGILHTIYGPNDAIASERTKFPSAIANKALRRAREGGPIEIWGNGLQMRSYGYISDAVKKITAVLAADRYDGPVNIGAEGAVSCVDVAELCCNILGIEPDFQFNPDQPSGVLARDCDNTKFRRVYGFDDEVSLTEGFAAVLKSLAERPADP